ncbi:tumor necrosis factor receptor type 1-associated DEATH domain protein [Spea bombifrons]|uniref:tumor necrosis factor receptor type 1-associated DEATH domain protein n=1 Tax=Spea bombifrons TaxID=233779 RepID=UPI00234BF338|nr:tumor necrosis factor receptor type 1-associated DEATH domain protein [Spea bombifrons]
MEPVPGLCFGSVYLFVHSDDIHLSDQYKNQTGLMYKAFSTSLAESSKDHQRSIEILKIHPNDRNLILYLKFCVLELCQAFLVDYKERKVHQRIQNNLRSCLSQGSVQVILELKVDSIKLDDILHKEQECLGHISSSKPSYQKDDELAELDKHFMEMTLEPSAQQNNISHSTSSIMTSPPQSLHSDGSLASERSTFCFHEQEYADRPLTFEDQQRFANLVGKEWKKVGRSLGKTCRALRDPAVDNLAWELKQETLYEQAYQLLLRFIQGEGRKATLKRLVDALVEHNLIRIAEELLHEQQNGLL